MRTFLILIICLMMLHGKAHGYTLNEWADAIRHAEGNSNYGILAHYKHTSYRQACKNTVRHVFAEYQASDTKEPFIDYLANKYAPIGASNDPTGLNVNWKGNVLCYLQSHK